MNLQDELKSYFQQKEKRTVSLLVLCSNSDKFFKIVQKENAEVICGGADYHLAFVFKECDDKRYCWHETLHLLGAQDCYTKKDPGPTCDEPNCIMQYQATNSLLTNSTFLCTKNIIPMNVTTESYSFEKFS